MDYKWTFVSNAVSNNFPKNDVAVLFNIGTSWLWNDIQPSYTMIYYAKGTNMAIFPAVVLNPPWTKKYFLKLQAIELLGGDKWAWAFSRARACGWDAPVQLQPALSDVCNRGEACALARQLRVEKRWDSGSDSRTREHFRGV